MYSKEDNTPAEKLPNQINGNTKRARYNKIMKLQNEISRENLKKYLHKELEVLIENKTFDGKYYIGRTEMDAPEIDGVVYIENNKENNLADKFVLCKITQIKEYDLIAKLI